MSQLLDNDISMMRALSTLSPSSAPDLKNRIRESEAVLAKLEAANESEKPQPEQTEEAAEEQEGGGTFAERPDDV